jgi:hypothetical protein
MPWDTEWGEEPEGAWNNESGIPWKEEWGEEPTDVDEEDNNNNDDDDMITKDMWKVGMPWDMEWGEEPTDADEENSNNKEENSNDDNDDMMTKDMWEAGMPWDMEWGEEPTDVDEENEENEEENKIEEVNFDFIVCDYIATSNPNALVVTVSLTKPGTVYYVFEDISIEFGSSYLPSINQIINGNNAFGNPNPKPEPNSDDEMEFPSEAFVKGAIKVLESNKEYSVTIIGPTFSEMKGEKFMDKPDRSKGSFVAVDNKGNIINK